MRELVQDRAAAVDVVVRSDLPGAPPREGLGAADLVVELKPAGAAAWSPKVLTAADWEEVGHGAYLLRLDPAEVAPAGVLAVLVAGQPALAPPILPAITELEVVPEREFSATRPNLPRTTLVGQVAGLDGRPLGRATVTATLLQVPVILEGIAVAGDAVIVASDDDGFFELRLITGATADVDIPAARWRRTLIVPPPPAPGVPLRLFSVP